MVYICPICGYKNDREYNYRRHLQRKNKCKKKTMQTTSPSYSKINTKNKQKNEQNNGQCTCKHCNATFVNKYSLMRHFSRCKVLKNTYKTNGSNL